MNEITKIHLGRQAFTISIEAHKELRDYLEAIERQVGEGSEVIKEVEMRMAELLAERGITSEKVVLSEDIAFLKEQLGEPKDFGDETSEAATGAKDASEAGAPKRLFRDTDNGMVAGVSSGLAAYFGIDAVIVRLTFIVLTLVWGWGILLYFILWLIVPEAKTSSERLQMRGKAVTVDSLKEIVDRADVQGAAQRAGRNVGPFIEGTFKVIGVLIGCLLVTVAIPLFLALMASGSYLMLHHGEVLQNVMPFPIGTTETVFTVAAFVSGILIAVGLLIWGLALATRKTISGWVAGVLVALLLITLTVGAVAAPDAINSVRDRYAAAHHTTSRSVAAFNQVHISHTGIVYRYEKSDSYQVDMRYVGRQNIEAVKTKVENGVLYIDTGHFKQQTTCRTLCIVGDGNNLELTIKAPELNKVQVDQHVIPNPPAGERTHIVH